MQLPTYLLIVPVRENDCMTSRRYVARGTTAAQHSGAGNSFDVWLSEKMGTTGGVNINEGRITFE